MWKDRPFGLTILFVVCSLHNPAMACTSSRLSFLLVCTNAKLRARRHFVTGFQVHVQCRPHFFYKDVNEVSRKPWSSLGLSRMAFWPSAAPDIEKCGYHSREYRPHGRTNGWEGGWHCFWLPRTALSFTNFIITACPAN